MRSKDQAISQNQVNMAEKPKSAKKRFRFRGGGTKKENGSVPAAGSVSSDPIDDGPFAPVQSAGTPSVGQLKAYQLSNSDIINGSVSHDQPATTAPADQLQCTCTCPEESVSGSPAPGHGAPNHNQVEGARPGDGVSECDDRLGADGCGNVSRLSVTAVIENAACRPSAGSSNDSSSGTSVCTVRPQTTAANSELGHLDVMAVSHVQRSLASRAGDRSPSTQSLVSVASSTVTMDAATDSPFGPRFGSDRQKPTLGDIIQQIEARCKALLATDDFTGPDPYADLQFLAHQSRYNSDVHIKRRLVAKLVDSRLTDIFLRVFNSVHTVDYFGVQPTPSEALHQRSRSSSQILIEDGPEDARSTGDAASGGQVAAAADLPAGESASADHEDDRQDTKSVAEAEDASQAEGSRDAAQPPGPAMKNLRAAVTMMWNTSDKSPVLCEQCVKKGVIQLLLDELRDPRLSSHELKDQQRLYLVKGYLGILNNVVCFFNETRDIFRETGAVKILQPYLKSQLLLVKTKTIMLLSYIINESENDVINASDKNIGFMIKMLEATLEKDNHYSRKFSFWAVEVAAGLNRLGCFEANKDRIVEKGVLPLYLELIQKSCNEDERLLAAQGIWIFSYSEKARNLIQSDTQVISALQGLQQSSPRDEVRRAAAGALWIIEGRRSGVGAVPKSPKLPAGAGHIYISYHWTCVHFVCRLRDKLRSFGYKVFVDTENMGTCGLPLETVFEGLEKACVLILCMTQKYKDSPSCRNEVEHALRLRRDIVPLRLQQKYNPDGWLATVTNTRLIFDFSRDENLENVTMALIRELGPRGKSKSSLAAAAAAASVASMEQSEASRSASNQSVSSAGPSGSVPNDLIASRVLHWTESDVSHWLMDNGLTSAIDRFHSINGELLYEMRKMHQMAPESFFHMLRSELGFNWITQLKFTKALDKL